MKKQINEEINSMKFLLNYKRGVVISEQAAAVNNTKSLTGDVALDNIIQALKIGVGLPNGELGTNEEKLMEGLSLIKDKQTYDKVNAYLTKTPYNGYKSVVEMLNGELDGDNLPRAVQAKEYLRKAGLVLSYSVRDDKYNKNTKYLIPNTFKIGVSSSSKTNTTPPKATTLTPPKVTTPKTNAVKQKTPIPSELENSEGIKVFQNWLDLYKAPWATGFNGGILNRGSGYGNFGPRTQKAWNLYGKEYIQLLNNTKDSSGESPWMKSQLEKIKTEKPTNSFTAPIQKVGTPLQSAQNPAPTVNQGLSQLKPQ
jgi:hypothetical protein